MNNSSEITAPTIFPHILVVQASAGAGKTYSLALRYLQLLARAQTPSPETLRSMLALTFTVAAAQEMKSRIVSFLKEIALQTPQGALLEKQSGLAPQEAKDWLDCILGHYHSFQVKTIDSLHFQLVQALGRRINLWPELEASFDQSGWAKLMLNSLLARTSWDKNASGDEPAAKSLRELWEDIFSVYLHLEVRSGLHFLNWLEAQAAAVFSGSAGLDQFLGRLETTSIANLNARHKSFLDLCQEFSQILKVHGLENQILRFDPLEILDEPLSKIDSAFFAKDDPQKLFKKAALTKTQLPQIWAKYTALCRARNDYLLEKARLRVDPLVRLRQLLIRETERLGRSQGLLLGGWWTRLIRQNLDAKDLLQEAEIVLNAKWQHFLIDEFQDTSWEQWEVLQELILEALAHGGSLFCVGDVKQAIYGWRGGDWRLFFEPLSPQTFPNVEDQARLQALLPFNRRSCPEIVIFNNICFASLKLPERSNRLAQTMLSGKDKDQARSVLAANISRLYADAEQKSWQDCVGQIQSISIKAESFEQYRAMALTALTEEILTDQAAGRALSQIAVLVRTNAEAGECAKALLNCGIPTITEHSLLIAGHPHVRGLIALLAWLNDPGDDAALYALFQSPLLAEAGLEVHALLNGSSFADDAQEGRPPLYHLLRQTTPHIWARHLLPFWKHAGFFSTYEVLLGAVTHFQLRNLPLGEWAWVEKLLEAAWNAQIQGADSIASFLEFWREKGRECVVGLPEGLEAVRVLTMHKAKGLEFPHVLMPLLDYAAKNRSAYRILHAAAGQSFLVSTARPRSWEVAEVVDQEQIKSLAEELNLLYVAMTRAKQSLRLFLADLDKAGGSPKGSRASDWLRALIRQASDPRQAAQ
jgi:ATP-dependent exoDNAse (exonuclease V) beta subunit